jgi:ribosomal-protein-alanine N-acetyltransferase
MTAEDLEAVCAIAQALPQAPHWPKGAYLDALNHAAAPRRVALVAEAVKMENSEPASSILGFVVASLVPPQAELETIAVAPEAQRQGLARRLFGVFVEESRRAGITEVMLEVRAGNQPAIALYRGLGFIETGRRPRYYADPVEDALLFSLRIARPNA